MNNKKGLFIITGLAMVLSACGGTPINPDDLAKFTKVTRALNAVETSLSSLSQTKQLAKLPNYALNDDFNTDELTTIFANADTSENIGDQIDFTSPPLIQFKYLKAIYEKLGTSYSFNTKYGKDITGTIYLDFETGYKDEDRKEENKYNYTLNMSIILNIDENDLITADVGFDALLTQGDKRYKSYRYVTMELDYDFSKNDNNYKLALYDTTSEKELTYLHTDRNFEYDYAEVSANNLTEWRKFRYEADFDPVKDEAHQTLDAYLDEGKNIETDNARWYKNSTLRRIDRGSAGSLEIAKLLFKDTRLNSTDMNASAYFAKEWTSVGAIEEIYQQTSQIFGDDLIYHLIARNKEDPTPEQDSGWPREQIKQNTGLDIAPFAGEDVRYVANEVTYPNTQYALEITVTNASSNDYLLFEAYLHNEIGFEKFDSGSEDVHAFLLEPLNMAPVFILVQPKDNKVFVLIEQDAPSYEFHYDIKLGYPYNYPNSGYQSNSLVDEKAILQVAERITGIGNLDRYLKDAIDLDNSTSYEFYISQDIANKYEGGKAHNEVAKMYLEQYINEYISKGWTKFKDNKYFIYSGRAIFMFDQTATDEGKVVFYSIYLNSEAAEKLNDSSSIGELQIVKFNIHFNNGFIEERDLRGYIGDDIRDYIPEEYLSWDLYVDEEFLTPLTDDNCLVYKGLFVYAKEKEPEIVTTDLFIYEIVNGEINQIDQLVVEVHKNLIDFVNWNDLVGKKGHAYYDSGCLNEAQPHDIIELTTNSLYILREKGAQRAKVTFYVSLGNGEYSQSEVEGNVGDDVRNYLYGYNPSYLYFDAASQYPLNNSNCAIYEGMVIFYNDPSQMDTYLNIPLIVIEGDNIFSDYLSVKKGEDIRPYLSNYSLGFKIYLNSSWTVELDEYNCFANENMSLYAVLQREDESSEEQEVTVSVTLVIFNTEGGADITTINAKEGEDIRSYLSNYDGYELYYGSGFSTPLDDSNCFVTKEMVISLKVPWGGEVTSEESSSEVQEVYIPVLIYNSKGNQTGKASITVPLGEDVREKLIGYREAQIFIDEERSVLLTYDNCHAYDGMIIYVVTNR